MSKRLKINGCLTPPAPQHPKRRAVFYKTVGSQHPEAKHKVQQVIKSVLYKAASLGCKPPNWVTKPFQLKPNK